MSIEEFNTNPRLTRYLVENKLFTNSPLVVVDVGARDNFENLWQFFQDEIVLIGFEPDEEEATRLNQQFEGTNKIIYPYALHRDHQKREFYQTAFPASSGFCEPDESFLTRFYTAPNKKVVNKSFHYRYNYINFHSSFLALGGKLRHHL